MADEVRPGSWVGDTVEEFKQLPIWGKIAVGGVAVLVAGIGIYEYRKKQQTGTSPAPGSGSASMLSGGSLPPTSDPQNVIGTAGNPVMGPPGPQGVPGPQGPAGAPAPTPPQVPIDVKNGFVNNVPTQLNNPPKVTTVKPTPPKLQTYTVVHGDNLSSIAARLHIRGGWQALYNQNKSVVGSNPNLIYAGQKLNLNGLV